MNGQCASVFWHSLSQLGADVFGMCLRVTGYHDDAAIVTALWDGDEVKLPNAIDKVTGRRITS